ncbi:MAG TPA: aldehyde dehydrogenase family protein [Terriglobales bacterium]|nr:aldehyde dehydrogenase family protein [Terriglobales bacterium]
MPTAGCWTWPTLTDMEAADIQAAGRKISSINPATGEVLQTFDCADDARVQEAVQRARAAQVTWAALGLHQHIEVLRQFQKELVEEKTRVAHLITQEAGKPSVESLITEVMVVLDACRFLIQESFSILRDKPVAHGNLVTKAKKGTIVRAPYGVIGIISPWNYPFATPATEVLAALVAGNAVVLKPSEYTPLCALKLEELLHRAGVPEDVFKVIVGDGSAGAALLGSAIDKLIFTGSVATGKRVAEAAAGRLLPVVLELGGKDPMLVLEDADIDVASSGAVWGAFVNAGQACLSVERCYVDRKVHEKFVNACAEKATELRVGNGMLSTTDVGPLIHERQLELVESHVEDARRRGARVVTGGKRLPELGPTFYAPTVLSDVIHEMRIMREETFGPVLPIMAFDTEEQAVQLANDSEFGLAASVWTRNRAHGEKLARVISAGTVMVNDVVSCFGISEAPHGGVKASGIGRTHGSFGLEEMVTVKYLSSDRVASIKKPWWYCYGEEFTRQMNGFVDLLFSRRLRDRVQGVSTSAGVLRRKGLL